MPFLKSFEPESGGIISWWLVEEEIDILIKKISFPFDKNELITKKSQLHQMQFLASRLLWQETCQKFNLRQQQIFKNKKWPELEEGYISISHSGKLCSLFYHPVKACGIDTDTYDDRLPEILKRVSYKEDLIGVEKKMDFVKIWCAKETLYKKYRNPTLIFKDDLKVRLENGQIIHYSNFNKREELNAIRVQDWLTVYSV
jgi:hypothetical protein